MSNQREADERYDEMERIMDQAAQGGLNFMDSNDLQRNRLGRLTTPQIRVCPDELPDLVITPLAGCTVISDHAVVAVPAVVLVVI